MKTVLFLTRRFAPHIGGVETHLHYLNNELKKHDASVTIITEQDSTTEVLTEFIHGVKVRRIALPGQITSKVVIWKWIIQHRSLFYNADVIHIHDVFFWILPIYPLLKLKGKRIFMTFHGYEGTQNIRLNQKFWHRLANILTDGNICIGGFHEKWYGVKPTSTSFGAVSNLPQKISKHELNKIVVRLIYLGRLAEDAGIMTYLAGLRMLSKSESYSLDVYGNGPQLVDAQKFAAEHKLPVLFHGFVPHGTVSLDEFDIAFVSGYLSLLEAFVTGLPVIAHYNSSIKKDYLLLSPFGSWIVAAGSAEEIRDAYLTLRREKMTDKVLLAQQWAKKQTWPRLARKYLKLWCISE